MTKPNISMINTNTVSVGANSSIPLGNIARRYGCALDGNNNQVNVKECGYYLIAGTITLTAASTGNVTIQIYQEGSAVPAIQTQGTIATADTQILTLPIIGIVRLFNGQAPDALTLYNSGIAIEMTNLSFDVIKL